jgi:hypothetical protein
MPEAESDYIRKAVVVVEFDPAAVEFAEILRAINRGTHALPIKNMYGAIADDAAAVLAIFTEPTAPLDDSLPEWLFQRFQSTAPFRSEAAHRDWLALSTDDVSFWGHEAEAVRRAVARNGFRVSSRPGGTAVGEPGGGAPAHRFGYGGHETDPGQQDGRGQMLALRCVKCRHRWSDHGHPSPWGGAPECSYNVGQGDWCACKELGPAVVTRPGQNP